MTKRKQILFLLLLFAFLCLLAEDRTDVGAAQVPDISYQAHVQDIGWQDYAENGKKAGVTDGSHRLEAIKIVVSSHFDDDILYRSYVSGSGWESAWSISGMVSGTTGRATAIEAVQIKPGRSAFSEKYDIYYSVYVKDSGWTKWEKNGAAAGTTGQSKWLEAIKIKIVTKGSKFDTSAVSSDANFNVMEQWDKFSEQVNVTEYDKFEDALADAIKRKGTTKQNVTLKLNQDATVDSRIVIDGVTLKIDLNGHNIRRNSGHHSSNGTVIWVRNGANLAIVDSQRKDWTVDDKYRVQGGYIAGGSDKWEGGDIYIGKDSTCTMQYCGLYDNNADKYGGGVYVTENGKFVMYRGYIINCGTENSSTGDGGAIYNAGTIDLSYVQIKGCYSRAGAGAIFTGKNMSMKYTNFSDNHVFNSTDRLQDVTMSSGFMVTDSKGGTTDAKRYDSFWDALDAAREKKGSTLTLNEDVRVNSRIYIYGSILTIDLNGHYIRRIADWHSQNGEAIWVGNGGKLAIIDSQKDKEWKLDNKTYVKGGYIAGGSSKDGAGGIHVREASTCTMINCGIYNNYTTEHGGGVYVKGNGKFVMNNGYIVNCGTENSDDDAHGGAIYNEGYVELNNVLIDRCYADAHGGAIYDNGGQMHLNNVELSNCRCKDRGGAICHNGGFIWVNDCDFHDNTAEDDGGGIAVQSVQVYLYNIKMRNNKSEKADGGAIWINEDKVFIYNCDIRNNKCGSDGDGIYCDGSYKFNMQGKCIVKDNDNEDIWFQGKAKMNLAGLMPGSNIHVRNNNNESITNFTKASAAYVSVEGGGAYEPKSYAGETDPVYMATALGPFRLAPTLFILLELVGAAAVLGHARRREEER